MIFSFEINFGFKIITLKIKIVFTGAAIVEIGQSLFNPYSEEDMDAIKSGIKENTELINSTENHLEKLSLQTEKLANLTFQEFRQEEEFREYYATGNVQL